MCGIVGYTGSNLCAAKVILDALEKLEYRGYDSAGIGVVCDQGVMVRRDSGKLHKIRPLLEQGLSGKNTGIGHTRWATHGKPTQNNAHPHQDNQKKLTLVHNGIIENHLVLRQELESCGHKFHSDTDTEIIVHLVAHCLREDKDVMNAFLTAIRRLQGAWALAIINTDYPDRIFVARKNCPLIIGLSEFGNFVSSDAIAIIQHTREMVFIEDGQAGFVTPDSLELYEVDTAAKVSWKSEILPWNPVTAEKGGYRHFMLKEIHEQPDVIRNTIGSSTDEENGEIWLGNLNLQPEDLQKIKRIIITACGTAYYSGMVGKYLIERLVRIPVEVELASEFRYRDPVMDSTCLVIAVSQSGETADTLAAVEKARELGARTLAIVNVQTSTLTRKVHGNLFIHAGPEIGVASTKAYMAMVVAFELLALWLGRKTGAVNKERAKELIHGLKVIPQLIENMLQKKTVLERLAHQYLDYRDFLYLGRDLNYPTAMEGALKLKELSYIHAEGYASGEMKHGPIALIDKDCPVVAILTASHIKEKVLSNILEARARDCKVLAIACEEDFEIREVADDIVWVPEVDPLLSPLINVVPLQLFAYYVADLKGFDVDQPRNLAKSVTVE